MDHPERIQVFIQALLEEELMAFFGRWKVGASSSRRCPIGLPERLWQAALAHLGDRDDHGAAAAGPRPAERADFELAFQGRFAQGYGEAHPKAVAILERDWDRMLTFHRFPRGHWKHLRTINVVEFPFAAVRLQRDAAKRSKRVSGATALI